MPAIVITFNNEEIGLEGLLDDFAYHLKRNEGISGFAKAHRQRQAIIDAVRRFATKKASETKALTMQMLYAEVQRDAGKKAEVNYFLKFLDTNGYGPERVAPEVERETVETVKVPRKAVKTAEVTPQPVRVPEAKVPPLIGRIALTMMSPARPSDFTFWVTESKDIRNQVPIEPGRLISTTSEGKEINVLGIITDVETRADMNSPTESFYGHGVGDPAIRMPTEPVMITTANVEVVYRSDKKAEPVAGQWEVRPATSQEIRKAYGSEIRDKDELLIGFAYDWEGNLVPIPAHVRHILGYEAGHINIAGAAGAATKTSYALFLLFSILAQARREESLKVAAVAFNVKEADLLRIDRLPSWDEVEQWSRGGPRAQFASFWKFVRALEEPYPIDPHVLKEGFKFFVPQRVDGSYVTLRERRSPTSGFRYSALDLAETRSLHLLLDPQDLDDKATAVLQSLMDEIRSSGLSFDRALQVLRQPGRAAGEGRWVTIGGAPHHIDTVYKVRNRAENAVQYQLADMFTLSDLQGQPIPIWELFPGNLWVIDISRIHDKGQRLIFHWIMKALHDFLEKKRTGEKSTTFLNKKVDLSKFPDRVVVFVDELNKFAPWGAEASAIKRDIVEITARGRSIGLSLIGAQQLASRVDEEILANTSTFAVGRSHPIEIGRATYGWLPKGLKERTTTLERGWMIVWHGAHKRPVFISFPKPLHDIAAPE